VDHRGTKKGGVGRAPRHPGRGSISAAGALPYRRITAEGRPHRFRTPPDLIPFSICGATGGCLRPHAAPLGARNPQGDRQGRAKNVIRAWLWPILRAARVAEKPAAAKRCIISPSA